MTKDGEKKDNIKNFTNIILYGAGKTGKRLCVNLINSKIKVICFIDKSENIKKNFKGIPVYNIKNRKLLSLDKKITIVLSGMFNEKITLEIKKSLEELGFFNIKKLSEIRFASLHKNVFFDDKYDGTYNKISFSKKQKNKIMEAYHLFEKKEDKFVYKKYIFSHINMSFEKLKQQHKEALQYLGHDIPVKKNFTNFIDCGAYDGDTIENIISSGFNIKKISAFEPNIDNYKKLSYYLNRKNKLFDSLSIFPCGVFSKVNSLKASAENGDPTSYKLDTFSNETAICVTIDTAISGFEPTFIKMDIEGAELEALKGAKQTIIKHRPQMAICVYHSLSDIWEIPLLINKYAPGYKFFLRNYNIMGLETVLYAFPQEHFDSPRLAS